MDFLKWFGNASFSFVDKRSGNRAYWIDPFDLKDREIEPADLVFITHAHYDHFSPDDLEKVLHDETVIVAPLDILDKINRDGSLKKEVLPNQSYEIKGFKFSTIPAYNINPQRLSFHPKANNWVGFIFEINGQKVYHAGDTDFTPEMKDLNKLNLDIAMLPIGGTYTMDVSEAIDAANAIAAKTTIPMHYKRLLGDRYKEAEEKFKTGVTASKVVILEEVK